MDGISQTGGFVGAQGMQLAAEYQTRVAVLQKDAAKMEGEMALKLIEAASIPTGGQTLDIKV